MQVEQSKVCLHITEKDSFSTTVTGKTYNFPHKFDSSDKYLIYLLKCQKCLNQYVG